MLGGGFMKRDELERILRVKKKELAELVTKKNNLKDREVYNKSRELDRLVVEYMRIKAES
ncbi:MAG TPA: aspartyl-phosphate phosphatase Spo0E family protein [Peptococcaceae bacterium]|nr:MAG: hypothetical protein XD50_1105 [Clostridia bacterium 41_269]HBT20707.1 aspartyl-phosphate phosphatase Spo0E family protein [Peptococcaceae bacterium]